MRIKDLVLTSTLAVSIIGSSLAFAAQTSNAETTPMTKITQSATPTIHSTERHNVRHQGLEKLLTVPQRAELHTIRQAMWTEMRPLLKEKYALRLQLMGKIATPNVQWSEVTAVLNKVNANNTKITTLLAKTQFTSFQKLGISLPLRHKHHAYSHKHSGHGKRINYHQYC